jgi:hypothetical protein
MSTTPDVAPISIPARVKGRLQHLIRQRIPKAFQRNYSIRSVGGTRRTKVERYIASQTQRHRMADAQVQARMTNYQIHLALGCGIEESPQNVALSYMNNIAYVHGMRSVLQFGCFMETVGEYDVGAVQ